VTPFDPDTETAVEYIARLEAEVNKLQRVVDWVESWVTNPVGSYSVAALDGLFCMTRDRINAL